MNNTYKVDVRRFAGDPTPKQVIISAVNRRHAEGLVCAQYPAMLVGDAERVA